MPIITWGKPRKVKMQKMFDKDKVERIILNGCDWYYEIVPNDESDSAVRLYDSEGEFLAEFKNMDECVSYAQYKSDGEAREKRQYKQRADVESVLDDVKVKIQAVFIDRIERLIGDDGYQRFAEKIDSNRSTVYNYAHGIRFPTAAALSNIADKCNVSVDWLLGRE